MFALDRVDRQLGNLSEMMERLGLDPAVVAQERLGLALSSAIRGCQACRTGEVCRDWLLRATPSLRQAPAFCPNADTFARLLADRAFTGSRDNLR